MCIRDRHSAIFQSLEGGQRKALHKILLTASGGPFRGRKREELENIQVEDALKHPNWEMGRKITIDSSTMVNKGLEVIEAKWLFDVDVDQVEVVVQPQSIIHSMVAVSYTHLGKNTVINLPKTLQQHVELSWPVSYTHLCHIPTDRRYCAAMAFPSEQLCSRLKYSKIATLREALLSAISRSYRFKTSSSIRAAGS